MRPLPCLQAVTNATGCKLFRIQNRKITLFELFDRPFCVKAQYGLSLWYWSELYGPYRQSNRRNCQPRRLSITGKNEILNNKREKIISQLYRKRIFVVAETKETKTAFHITTVKKNTGNTRKELSVVHYSF